MIRNSSGKLIKFASVLCATTLVFGGCGLFAEEEEAKSIAIVRENMEDEYDIIHCEKHDIKKTAVISCSYKQLMEENLSFPVGDKSVAFVYVNEGDEVKAGDLVAKLDVGQLETDNINMREQVEKNEFLIKQVDEKIEYYEKKIESPGISLSTKESYLSKLQSLREKRRSYSDENEFNLIKISANEQQIANGCLYAGMDGNISYIKDNLVGSNVNAGEKVITILSAGATGFQAQDRGIQSYVNVGDVMVVECPVLNQSFDVKLTSADPDNGKMVFELLEPDFSITVGTRGKITVVQGEVNGAFSLPNTCVFETDEFSYTYILNDEGVREMRKVEVGLKGDDFVEITGGITEADSVILRRS